MPRDRKYKTKNTNYKPGNVTNIVKAISQSEPGMRMPYVKGVQHDIHQKVEDIKEGLGIESSFNKKMRKLAKKYSR